jgi:hypothetical protein
VRANNFALSAHLFLLELQTVNRVFRSQTSRLRRVTNSARISARRSACDRWVYRVVILAYQHGRQVIYISVEL